MYYVRVKTRGPGAAERGSPKQALDYISDPHGEKDEAELSHAEVLYIARLGEGWKTELEGGRVPLHGLGTLAKVESQRELRGRFDDACLPYHDKRATTGYKSLTFTLPREMSLIAEGHRAEARELMAEALRQTLDRAFSGFDYTGVTALHTRNEDSEVHYHLHVLISKFGYDHARGKVVSINNPQFGWLDRSALAEIKRGWKENIDQLFKERFDVTIEQKRANGPVTLTMPDGTRLEPLNRDSRRVLGIALCPLYAKAHPDGHLSAPKPFELTVMDDAIYEVAARRRGHGRWDSKAFEATFPAKARFVGRYQKRVESLKAVGYLTADGTITPAFRIRYSVRKGPVLPELQALRLELIRELRNSAPHLAGANEAAQAARYRAALDRLGALGVPSHVLHSNKALSSPSSAAPSQPPKRPPAPVDLRQQRDEDEDNEPPPPPWEPPRGPEQSNGSPSPRTTTSAQDAGQKRSGGPKGRRPEPDSFWAILDRIEALRARLDRLGIPRDRVAEGFDASEARRPSPHALNRARNLPPPKKRSPGILRAVGRTVMVPRDQVTQDMERLGAVLGAFFDLAPAVSLGAPSRPERRPIFAAAVVKDPRSRPDNLRHRLDQAAPLARGSVDERLRESSDVLTKLRATREHIEAAASAPGATITASRHLRLGLDAMRTLRPEEAASLDGLDLLKITEAVLAQSKGQHTTQLTTGQFKTALQAGRMGRLLEREQTLLSQARRPDGAAANLGDAAQHQSLMLLRARLKALAISVDLTALPTQPLRRSQIESVLTLFDGEGLLCEGAGWTLQRERFQRLATKVVGYSPPRPEPRKR